VVLPNGKLAAAQVTNYSTPTPRNRCTLTITLDGRIHPSLACKALACKALACTPLKSALVLADPPPEARIKEMRGDKIDYEISYWVDGFAHTDKASHAVAHAAWHTLDALGFGPWTADADGYDPALIGRRLVAAVDLFDHLDPASRERIADALRAHLLEPGEVLIRAGEAGNSLFIVETGALDVILETGEADGQRAARLGPGDLVGEMSLLTGEPRTATVVAVTECRVLELSHAAMKPIMTAKPEIAEGLSHLMAQRRLANAAFAAEMSAAQKREAARRWSEQILGDMVAIFGLTRGKG
jgi:CRP-like cAMP-binding protein